MALLHIDLLDQSLHAIGNRGKFLFPIVLLSRLVVIRFFWLRFKRFEALLQRRDTGGFQENAACRHGHIDLVELIVRRKSAHVVQND